MTKKEQEVPVPTLMKGQCVKLNQDYNAGYGETSPFVAKGRIGKVIAQKDRNAVVAFPVNHDTSLVLFMAVNTLETV